MYLECKQCCHVLRGALRALEETVDDNVLTLAGLSLDPLKEKTSELAAKRTKTRNLSHASMA